MKRSSLFCLLVAAGCSNPAISITDGYVEVSGATLYYEEAGVGSPVVMIHGGYLDRRMWDGQFETFAHDYRVIRYDVRAHGLSRAEPVAFADHEDLRRLLVALRVERAVIVGLSMGGGIAVDFALAYPEMVAGLVLAGPGLSGFGYNSDELQEYIDELTAAFETKESSEIFETFARWWCDGPQRDASQVDLVVRQRVLEMLAGSEQRWEYAHFTEELDPPATEWLHQIRKPTLAISGSIDMPDIHQIVDLILERIPGAEKVVILDVAHMVNMEAPVRFNEAVLDFLERIEPW